MRPRRTIAALATTAAVLSAAACSNSAGTEASPGGEKPDAALTLVANLVPSGLDPDSTIPGDSGIQLTFSHSYMGMLFSYNGDTGEDGEVADLQPDLAESAEESADGTSWTVTLRDGVESSAGNPLTADDVVWTMQRVVAAKVNGANLLTQANIDLADPVTKVDDRTVTFNLTAPSPIFRQIMSLPYLGILDSKTVQEHVTPEDPSGATWLATNTASYGPYTVTSINPKTEIVMAANPDYWMGEPQITTATWRTVQDANTALQTAITGQSDYTITTPASNLETLANSPDVTVHTIQTNTTVYMSLDQANPALANPLVRRAVTLATDREAMAESAYAGAAEPVPSCLPESLGTEPTESDNGSGPEVDEARALVDEAKAQGPLETITIGILPSAFAESEALARILQSNLEDVGLTAEVKSYNSADTISADFKSHKLSGFMLKQAPSVPDAGYFMKAFFLSTSPYNFSSYASTDFDQDVNAAMAQSGDERQQTLQDACETFLKEAPANMLLVTGNNAITKKTIGNVLSYPDIAPRLYNLTVG